MSYENLNPIKALIWRIVHRANLPWILENGLHAASSITKSENYVAIGNKDLIVRRTTRAVPKAQKGTLDDYIPFYFTPFSPMMYNIHTGRGEVAQVQNQDICILVSSLHKVSKLEIPFVFTDRHAYTPLAQFYNNVDELEEVDWALLRTRDFTRNQDDPEQIERYQAEALIFSHLPIEALLGVVCYNAKVKSQIIQQAEQLNVNIDVKTLPKWYF